MKAIDPQEISSYSKESLQSMVVEQSQQLSYAVKLIRNLEKEVERLANELGAKNQKVLFSLEKLNNLKASVFGSSSERREDIFSPLFDIGDEDRPPNNEDVKGKAKKRKKFGRKDQPDLPKQEILHTYSQEDVERFGLSPWEGQFEISELINVKPCQFILEIHKRQKYLKKDPLTNENSIVTAPGPLKLKEKSRYSIEFAVEVGLAKYHWHLPLDRQRKMMEALGLDVNTNTLYEQIDTIAWYLDTKVHQKIIEDIEASQVAIADETSWKNLEKKNLRDREKFFLWAVMNERAVCFNIFDSRSQKIAKNYLGNLKGVLVTDGLGVYKVLASEHLILANDWYHVRRKFIAAEKNFPEESAFFIKKIRELSEIEEQLKGKPPDEILRVRQEQSSAIVSEIGNALAKLSNILPQSSLGRAIKYTDKLWDGLSVFLSNPHVPMHSNDVERVIRGPAVGRKNHYGSKNLESARTAAVWYSIVETCKLNNIDPRAYIVATIKAILQKETVIMPWEWKPDLGDLILN